MTPLQQLEERLREIDNDPGIRAHRANMRRLRPDLSNKSDTDVLGWMQRILDEGPAFYDAYDRHASSRGFGEYAEEIVYLCKCLVTAWQDAEARHEECWDD